MKNRITPLIVTAMLTVLSACNITTPENNIASQNNKYSVQFIGTATVLIQYGDLTILTDPALDMAGGHYDMGFTTLHKTANPALTADDLPNIDLVLVSHDQHQDNFDTLGRKVTSEATLALSTKEAAKRMGGNTQGLAWWESHQIGDVTITAVPAQHGPAQAVPLLGTVNGFIISSLSGPTIYISGDTVPFKGTQEITKRYAGKIDYALLHTGQVAEVANKPPFFTMSANDALTLTTQLDVPQFSIIHADSWAHFKERLPEALTLAKSSTIADRLLELPAGATVNIK